MRCHACGTTAGIYEYQYGDTIECEGGCGLKFRVDSEYIGSGICEEIVYAFYDEEEDIED